jgi:hypothetical protein
VSIFSGRCVARGGAGGGTSSSSLMVAGAGFFAGARENSSGFACGSALAATHPTINQSVD